MVKTDVLYVETRSIYHLTVLINKQGQRVSGGSTNKYKILPVRMIIMTIAVLKPMVINQETMGITTSIIRVRSTKLIEVIT